MKTLVLFGGARKNGQTMRMLEHFLARLGGEQERLYCYALHISPCVDCRHCQTEKACAIRDDMQEYYKKIDAADNIVFATPVYFFGVPGPLKTLIDRLQVYWSGTVRGDKDTYPPKKAAILLSAGARPFPDQFTAALLEINAALRELNAENLGEVLLPDSDRTGIADRPDLTDALDRLADAMKEANQYDEGK